MKQYVTHRVTWALLLGLVSGTVVIFGCGTKGGDDKGQRVTAPVVSAREATKGPDRLGTTPLAVGREKAFGLALPLATPITVREAFRIQADGKVALGRVVAYMKGHVDGESEEQPDGTVVFSEVVVRGEKGPKLRIEIKRVGRGTRVTVHNLEPPRGGRIEWNVPKPTVSAAPRGSGSVGVPSAPSRVVPPVPRAAPSAPRAAPSATSKRNIFRRI